MKKFLVGGAVRDQLLGLPVKERDWVVVGETADNMVARGYQPVGKDFPVFLHPDTKEEYALARLERKTAAGYHGFTVDAGITVTLKEDLLRRDLTINAMAFDPNGSVIDPYGGRHDLEAKRLRHVSAAFGEDPVRILRVARLKARYAHLGFTVAAETTQLMKQMVVKGEVDALVAERVWSELVRALAEPTPTAFFEVLRSCGALARLFPEIESLYGVPQPEQHHPEIDTGVHTMMVLEQAAKLSDRPLVRFAALTHDLGKGLTPPEQWPSHHRHEVLGLPALDALCERFRVPSGFHRLANKVMRFHGLAHRAFDLTPATLLKTFENLDLFRQPETLEPFLLACHADIRGRIGFETHPYPQAELFRTALKTAQSVKVQPLIARGLKGKEIGTALHQQRVEAIRKLTSNYSG